MKSIYPRLKDTYKIFAGTHPIGDVWCIPQYNIYLKDQYFLNFAIKQRLLMINISLMLI